MNSSPWNFTRLVRPLLLMLVMTVASASYAGLFISVTVAPPPLPIYVQPPCPEPGFIWIPGYWAWGDEGYYWIPGTWVPAPQPGYYWTPGYWGWNEGVYAWNDGYWGPHVGYYGGVNYGFGYFGLGFVGGEWHGRDFYYNRAVVNVNTTRITNVYVNRTVIVNNYSNNHVSFNGPGGIQRQPTQRELVAVRENHVQPTALQTQHWNEAQRNPQLLVRNNGGKPPVAATARPGDFASRSVVPARATGGRVDTTVLRATPKNIPAAPARAGRAPETGGNRTMAPSRAPEAGGNRPVSPG